MVVKEYIHNTSLALLGAFVIFLLVYAIPSKTVSSEKHFVIEQIGKIRFIGPILIIIGIIGCLYCLWNFILDANGSPFSEDQKQLIVLCISSFVIFGILSR